MARRTFSGMEVVKVLVNVGGFEWRRTTGEHAQIYPNLDELVDKGLIEKGFKNDRTNQYSLTNRGRSKIEARRQWEDILIDSTSHVYKQVIELGHDLLDRLLAVLSDPSDEIVDRLLERPVPFGA